MNLQKFTEKAQQAILTAQQTAERAGHAEIQPEHLLLALLQQADGIVPANLPDPEPGDDDGDADDGAGMGKPPPMPLEPRPEAEGRRVFPRAHASSDRISWNTVSPVRSMRRRYGRHRPH